MHDSESFRALVAHVGEFYLTEKKLKSAQARIESMIASGEVNERERVDYLSVVRGYFDGFEKEARRHLRSLDKRLDHINQVHFNLTAERAVAVRRIDATQQVLADLEQLAR